MSHLVDNIASKESMKAKGVVGFGDILNPTGSVRKRLINKATGEIVSDMTDHNLVVKVGRAALVKMLSGSLTSSITKMDIGKGGTADLAGNAFNPIPPTDGDTALANKIVSETISSRVIDEHATNPSVTFIALFDCAIVNSLVNECGLFFTDGTTMFGRHTFDTVSLKESANFSLEISWTIQF